MTFTRLSPVPHPKVNCFEADRMSVSDANQWWLIEPPDGDKIGARLGNPVLGGDKIRLVHTATSRRLRSGNEIPA
jgi:dolichyl-phosphate-mannose--protein O-mannosyl transferase